MLEPSFLMDSLFTILSCISAGFLVYGGWLCLPVWRAKGMLPQGNATTIDPRSTALS